jgi:hypothetical protein
MSCTKGRTDSREQVLLQALTAAMHLTHSSELEANQVNELATLLHLPLTKVPQLVVRLQDMNLVRLYWGGRVALTPEGQACMEERALYTVAGSGPLGPRAIQDEMIDSLGNLTAVLQALRHTQEGLSPQAKAIAQQLEGEVTAIVQEVQRPQLDRTGLAQQLDQATALLVSFSSSADATQRLGSALTLLGTTFGVVRRWAMEG